MGKYGSENSERDKQREFRRSLVNSCFTCVRAKNLAARRSRASLRLRTRSGEGVGREGKGKEREPGGERPLPAVTARVTHRPCRRACRGAGSGLTVRQSLPTASSAQGTEQGPNPCDKHVADPWVPDPAGWRRRSVPAASSVLACLFRVFCSVTAASGASELGHGSPREPGWIPTSSGSPSVPSHSLWLLVGRGCRVVCWERKGVLL